MNASGASATPIARLVSLAARAVKALGVRAQAPQAKAPVRTELCLIAPNVLVNGDWYDAVYGDKGKGGVMIVGSTADGILFAYLP
jgi:hypothetical protein